MNDPGRATRFVWFIGISLVSLFALVLILPALFRLLHPDAPPLVFDAQLVAQLVPLVTGLVWWAIGSSQGSARKDEQNAAQQARVIEAMKPAPVVSALASAAPTGTPGDPVSVTPVPAP